MISLKNKPQVLAPTSTYPHGRIQDDDGSGTKGTPVDEQVYGDFHQFFSQLMKDANLTPNELPENEYDGFQLNNALGLFINKLSAIIAAQITDNLNGGLRRKLINIGDWNMDTTGSVSIAHGLTASKIRGAQAYIIPESGPNGILPLIFSDGDVLGSGGQLSWSAGGTTIDLSRFATGVFDSTDYDSTPFNRGYLIVEYIS